MELRSEEKGLQRALALRESLSEELEGARAAVEAARARRQSKEAQLQDLEAQLALLRQQQEAVTQVDSPSSVFCRFFLVFFVPPGASL